MVQWGRERMGTAFPHKKLSGNAVPIREMLNYFFINLLSAVTVIQHFVHHKPCQNWISEFSKYQRIKTNFQRYMYYAPIGAREVFLSGGGRQAQKGPP